MHRSKSKKKLRRYNKNTSKKAKIKTKKCNYYRGHQDIEIMKTCLNEIFQNELHIKNKLPQIFDTDEIMRTIVKALHDYVYSNIDVFINYKQTSVSNTPAHNSQTQETVISTRENERVEREEAATPKPKNEIDEIVDRVKAISTSYVINAEIALLIRQIKIPLSDYNYNKTTYSPRKVRVDIPKIKRIFTDLTNSLKPTEHIFYQNDKDINTSDIQVLNIQYNEYALIVKELNNPEINTLLDKCIIKLQKKDFSTFIKDIQSINNLIKVFYSKPIS